MTTPSTPPQPGRSDNDDIFSPLPSMPSTPQGTSSFQGAPAGGNAPNAGYIPPMPVTMAPPQRGPNVFVIILAVIGIVSVLICGGCLLLVGGGAFMVARDPTFQAAVSTVQEGFKTIQSVADMPQTLPSDSTVKGALNAGKPQSASLAAFERQAWTYAGHSGENITITTTPQLSSDLLILGIYDSGGRLLAKTPFAVNQSSGSKKQTVSANLPLDGMYTILVGAISPVNSYGITLTTDQQPR